MTDVSSALFFYTTDEHGAYASFALKEAVATVAWQAEKELSQTEVDSLVVYLNVCDKHLQDMLPRIYAWKLHG
jgi:hypothetical protein